MKPLSVEDGTPTLPVPERTAEMINKCTCKHMHGHEGCVAAVDVSCGCVLHDDDAEERTAEMEELMGRLRELNGRGVLLYSSEVKILLDHIEGKG